MIVVRRGARGSRVALCLVTGMVVCAAAGVVLLGATEQPIATSASAASKRSSDDVLSVAHNGSWVAWWRADAAPTHWSGALPSLTEALQWRPTASDGVQWGDLHLSGPGEAWRLRVILARIDPRRVRIRLDTAFEGSLGRAAWTIDRAAGNAVVAVNAGQFVGSLPWGWVVLGGSEFLARGHGPLSTAVVLDSSGALEWLGPTGIPDLRSKEGRALRIAEAFQSYPTLLQGDGDIPKPLQPGAADGGVDLGHRDARLAIGQLRDGRVLIAMTRIDAPGGALDYVPFGLTTPEMAAVMGALGCSKAVMLDGGISSQMMIRTSATSRRKWHGVRRVPLGLVVVPAG